MSQQAGWYDDPEDNDKLRYWDGVQWTNHTSPKRKADLDQAGEGGYGQQGWGAAPGQQGHGQGGYGQGQGQGQQGGYGQPGGEPNPYAQQPNPYSGQTGHAPYQGRWQGYAMPGGYATQTDPRSVTPDGQPLAGWGMRLLARIIDWIILAVVALVLFPILAPGAIQEATVWWEELLQAAEQGATATPEPPTAFIAALAPWIIGQAVVAFLYELLLVKQFGGTLGKLVTGLRVRMREEPGVTWGAAGIRAFVWQIVPSLLGMLPVLGFLGSVFPLLNGLWPLWDPKRQALHDKAARTNVVRKQR